MSERKYRVPSTSALIAFECVARLRGFGRAAASLHTSQSAISRHIRNLESRLGVELFDREGPRVSLTAKGEAYYAAVSCALEDLNTATLAISKDQNELTVVCSHEVSHLLLMPHYATLRNAIGEDIQLRILTTEYDLLSAAIDTGADIVFEYAKQPPARKSIVVCQEQIKAVGTSRMVEEAKKQLARKKTRLSVLQLNKTNFGWANWHDWQQAQDHAIECRHIESFDNYVYLLEAATQGMGLALGWRGFVNRYLDSGALVPLHEQWLSRDTKLYARLTRFGEQRTQAHRGLECIEKIIAQDPA